MSFNNVGHLITSTITTLQHFATLNHTSPNYTSLHLSTLHFPSFTFHYSPIWLNPSTFPIVLFHPPSLNQTQYGSHVPRLMMYEYANRADSVNEIFSYIPVVLFPVLTTEMFFKGRFCSFPLAFGRMLGLYLRSGQDSFLSHSYKFSYTHIHTRESLRPEVLQLFCHSLTSYYYGSGYARQGSVMAEDSLSL